ncbi:MAG TPA: molybdopterin biosynthesis protein [Methanospirillum sp.]|mgnify:CR=1 FL=1|uniref:molybdopterin biosynthesis protein n=1 Tax=Methanospirillum sp. TaxID=45200 RepID=UPI002CE45E07|nr:molybdopterin biosynthesis protein [Methanospirillum sp.]HOJ96273.1 molybdopterin biosynthesis protein [Methanospirillum sp.]HPP78036.1 molybdopterin biosynthesis protein [Methanospirillum sp.]
MTERFFHLQSLSEGLQILKDRFLFESGVIRIPVQDSYGRVTAHAVYSPLSFPAGHLSAMDGIAVRAADTHGATDQNPVLISDYARVNTGNLIPPGYDAVIMIEHTEEADRGFIIRSPAYPWQHIRPVGEDIAKGEMVLPGGHTIRSGDVGAMASYGIQEVDVLSLRVALIPTGSEIVPLGSDPKPGQVIESNMLMAAAEIRSTGADVTLFPIIPDDPDQIRSAISEAVMSHDLVLISAGSSKGTKDYTSRVISELGTVFVHGLSIKPAKPVIFGDISGKPVIGMPGYPIACHTILREIIRPVLSWYGLSVKEEPVIQARLSSPLFSDIGVDEFVLITVGRVADTWVAVPQSRGSGIQMSLVRSNGILSIPSSSEGYEAGSAVSVRVTSSVHEAEQTILISGSHDPVIDHLSDLVRGFGIIPASVHVGSMGGLMALKRGDCHLAPMHLLSDDGEYNISFLRRYMPNEDLVLICVAEREQGIVSREGLGFEAITTHRFVNRQKGSGTRILLDHMLKEKGISSESIQGYAREVTTHLAVCLAVMAGDADMGMAVSSAAKAYDLPFVPVATERYELVMKAATFASDVRVQTLISCIQSDSFKTLLSRLGGYRTGETGVIRRLSPA